MTTARRRLMTTVALTTTTATPATAQVAETTTTRSMARAIRSSTSAPPTPDGGPGCIEGDCGCTAVDILFVIDDSTSMGSYQQGLAAAAPGFADAIFASLPAGTDLHVGVTTSSFFGGSGGTSPGETNCSPYYEGAGLTDRDDLFMWYWTPDDMPYDANGAQGRLREHEGMTYFATKTDADPAPMKNWLVGNITAVGEHGSVWEMVAAGAAYPFHPANAAHNAGFLRDEGAVLVILTLTDEVDNSPEDVQTYHDMISAAKSGCGGDQCIVTAGIHKPCLATAPDNVLYPLLASFGEQPAVADIGPELDDCFDDCADGDITECNAVQPRRHVRGADGRRRHGPVRRCARRRARPSDRADLRRHPACGLKTRFGVGRSLEGIRARGSRYNATGCHERASRSRWCWACWCCASWRGGYGASPRLRRPTPAPGRESIAHRSSARSSRRASAAKSISRRRP